METFTFVDHPDGTTTSSARPARRLDPLELARVRELRAGAERLERWHHDGGSSAAADELDPSALLGHLVEIARDLRRRGLTVDEIASYAGLSLTALRRWLDAPARAPLQRSARSR